MSIEITTTTTFAVPGVPNFLLPYAPTGNGDAEKISIADVSDEDLQRVGLAWTDRLIERATEIRASKDPTP